MNKLFLYLVLAIAFNTTVGMQLPKKKRYKSWATRKLKNISRERSPYNSEIRECVDKGADPNYIVNLTKYSEQWSLLRLAVLRSDRDPELIRRLLDSGAKPDDISGPLQTAITLGYFDRVEELVQAGANINSCNYQNETPLFVAIKHNMVGIIPFLIEHGAVWLSEDIEQKLKTTHSVILELIRKHHLQKLM